MGKKKFSDLLLQAQTTSSPFNTVKLLIVADDENPDVTPILKSLEGRSISFTYKIITTDAVYSYLSRDVFYDALIYYYPYREWNWTIAPLRIAQWLETFTQKTLPLILVAEALADDNALEYIKVGITNFVLTSNIFRLPDLIDLALNQSSALKQYKQSALEQKHKQEEFILQTAKILNSRIKPEQSLREILKKIGENFNADRVVLCRFDEDKIHVAQEWQINDRITSLVEIQTSIKEEIERRKKITYTEIVNKKIGRKIEDYHSGLLVNVPIYVKDEFYGSLMLQMSAQIFNLTLEEIKIIEIVAQQVAIALAELPKDAENSSERKEQRIQEISNCIKSEFMANIIHELRTPLAAVLGFSRMLDEEIYGKLNPKQKEYVNAISSCGEHLLELINDLLDLSKIEADKEELYLESVPVNDICLASACIVREQAQQKGLEFKLEIDPQVSFCTADQRRLKQILVNLLGNAIKFTTSGSVTLKVQQYSDRIEFSAIDTGIGIGEADQKILFQPFQQINNRLSRKHKGSGLGLALSRKLAKLHGGDLTVISEEGKGSCFTLQLPV